MSEYRESAKNIKEGITLSSEHVSFLIQTLPHSWEGIFLDKSGRLRAELPVKFKPCFGRKKPAETWNAISCCIPLKLFFWAIMTADPELGYWVFKEFARRFPDVVPHPEVNAHELIGHAVRRSMITDPNWKWVPLFSNSKFVHLLKGNGDDLMMRTVLGVTHDPKRFWDLLCEYDVETRNFIEAAAAVGYELLDDFILVINGYNTPPEKDFELFFHNSLSMERAFGGEINHRTWKRLAHVLPLPKGRKGFSNDQVEEFKIHDNVKPWERMFYRWHDYGKDIASAANLRAALKECLLISALERFDRWMAGDSESQKAVPQPKAAPQPEPDNYEARPFYGYKQPPEPKHPDPAAGARVTDADIDDGRWLAPFHGFENLPMPASLEDSLQKYLATLDAKKRSTALQKIEACEVAVMQIETLPEGMTYEMAAAIFLYTAPGEFYQNFNAALRNEKRDAAMIYAPYILLLNKALDCLPHYNGKYVFRGIKRGLNQLNERFCKKGSKFSWNSYVSTTSDIEVLKNGEFLGAEGDRTMWMIELNNDKPIARDIKNFSYYSNESELLIKPGTMFEVTGVLPLGGGLTQVTCRQLKTVNIFQ